jgi:hypothetical protein
MYFINKKASNDLEFAMFGVCPMLFGAAGGLLGWLYYYVYFYDKVNNVGVLAILQWLVKP